MENSPKKLTNKERLKLTPPEILASTNPPMLGIARDGGIVCPFCGNGSGDDGTGIKPDSTPEGYRYYCHRPHTSGESQHFDNIDIASKVLNLPIGGEENSGNFKKVIDEALKLIDARPADAPVNFIATGNSDSPSNKPARNFNDYYVEVNKALNTYVTNIGGTWRGLTLNTLNHFFCGYDKYWKVAKPQTSRLIIPTSPSHYLARFIDVTAQYKVPQDQLDRIHEKQHIGQKTVFGMLKATVENRKQDEVVDEINHEGGSSRIIIHTNTPIFIVEGEIDAMTGWQVTKGYDFFAIGGLEISDKMSDQLRAGCELRKTTFIVLMDDDDAGRTAAPKIAEKLVELGHWAIIVNWRDMGVGHLFTKNDGTTCKDLNEALTAGFEKNLHDFLRTCYDWADCIQTLFDEAQGALFKDADNVAKTNADFIRGYQVTLINNCKEEPPLDCDKKCESCMMRIVKPPTIPVCNFKVKGINAPVEDTPKTAPAAAPYNPNNLFKPKTVRMTRGEMKDCPIDLVIPDGFIFNDKGVFKNGFKTPFIYNPTVITKILTDADSGSTYVEISFFDYYFKHWKSFVVPNKTIFDHRNVSEITNFGLQFTQEKAKEVSEYLSRLQVGKNATLILHAMLHNRPGWINEDCTEFIYPGYESADHQLRNGVNLYHKKFSSAGDYDAWKEGIAKLFTDKESLPVFNLIFGAALAAPLLKICAVKNPQILLWCSTGKGKSLMAKIAMSIYGNPELLKNTFNATLNAINDMGAKFCDFPIWLDEFQSASEFIRKEVDKIIYSYESGKTRLRLRRDGSENKLFDFRGVRIMTAEQPILSDNANAGTYNRLISLSNSDLFPQDKDLTVVHRFFGDNYGHFGLDWWRFIANPDNHETISTSFKTNRLTFDAMTKKGSWTNGWSDFFALVFTALQLAMPMISPRITPAVINTQFFKKFSVIENDIPKNTSTANHTRALEKLQDYVNSHPRFFKYEYTGQRHEMNVSTDGVANELTGYVFNDGSVAFNPSELEKIIQKDLGFPSFKAILRYWVEDGLVITNNGHKTKYKKWIPNPIGRQEWCIYFPPNILSTSTGESDDTDAHNQESYMDYRY